jgi:hypothetical protein
MARMLVWVGMGALLACGEKPPGLRWVVPEGYEGCVTTRFHVKDAPPLPMDEGWYLITPAQTQDGQMMTSTRPQWGERLRTEFYAQTSTGRQIVQPSCDAGTTTNPIDGTVKLTFCFGPISKQECLRVQGRVAE